MSIHLPERVCTHLDSALRREWLVTNGLGGFSSGTIAGARTRRYHGLLIAALRPPLERRLLVAKFDETVQLGTDEVPLHTNIWRDGISQPDGCRYLRRFDLHLGVPTWTFAVNSARLIKRVWMEAGANTTYIQYALEGGTSALRLAGRLLLTDRDYHYLARGPQRGFAVRPQRECLQVDLPHAGRRLVARCQGNAGVQWRWDPDHTWWWAFHLPVEAQRGFDHLEDHLCAGACQIVLPPGATITLQFSVDPEPPDLANALARRYQQATERLRDWQARGGRRTALHSVPVQQLVLAADQFLVARPTSGEPDGRTIIAGYPWFTDWGRDTMIALPGLTLVTGRPAIARQILRTWAGYVRDGLIPNRFPDGAEQPEYHTADATLWYLWAVNEYIQASADLDTLRALLPTLADIVACHRRGTRHNIHIDEDGLLYAGEPGVNLTWMDAKIGDRVITPRIGKPVELSALWYDGLCNLADLCDRAGASGAEYRRLARRTRQAFARFWNPATECCYDVLDGPNGNDPSLRPNQIFAVSLRHSPLTAGQQRAVVEACRQKLLTWFGLRSLAPDQPGYRGRYRGSPVERDEAYHQGTAWGWLLGPFVRAHYRVHQDRKQALAFLEPMLGQLWSGGIGSLSEVFDGDEPHTPDGCPAQAWSVAETLRAWWDTQCAEPRHTATMVEQ